MQYRLLRLYALLVQAIFCIFIFVVGVTSDISFFNTFIGPAALMLIIAFKPNFFYDIIALFTMSLIVILSLIFAFVTAFFQHNVPLALAAPIVPIACMATVIFCMDRLRKQDPSYS